MILIIQQKKLNKKNSESLLPKSNVNDQTEHNSVIRAILYATRYEKESKTNICDKNEFENLIDEKLIKQLDKKKVWIYTRFTKTQ